MIRRNLLAALLLAILPGTGAAGSWAAQLFDKLDHDWGRVDRGAQLDHQFTLTNNSSRELRIKRLSVSCQCTQAMTTPIIGPGETAARQRMDTSSFQDQTVSIFVSFDGTVRRGYTAGQRPGANSSGVGGWISAWCHSASRRKTQPRVLRQRWLADHRHRQRARISRPTSEVEERDASSLRLPCTLGESDRRRGTAA